MCNKSLNRLMLFFCALLKRSLPENVRFVLYMETDTAYSAFIQDRVSRSGLKLIEKTGDSNQRSTPAQKRFFKDLDAVQLTVKIDLIGASKEE